MKKITVEPYAKFVQLKGVTRMIEIVEFYPIARDEEKDHLFGTLRVKIPTLGIDLLGITVVKKKGYWNVSLPGKTGQETGKPVWYPLISLENREEHQTLVRELREKGIEFVQKKLADTEHPLIFPQNNQRFQQHSQAQEANKPVSMPQPSIKRGNQCKAPSIQKKPVSKIFVTPPKIATAKRKFGRGNER